MSKLENGSFHLTFFCDKVNLQLQELKMLHESGDTRLFSGTVQWVTQRDWGAELSPWSTPYQLATLGGHQPTPDSPAERAAKAEGYCFPSQGQTVVLAQCQHITLLWRKRENISKLYEHCFYPRSQTQVQVMLSSGLSNHPKRFLFSIHFGPTGFWSYKLLIWAMKVRQQKNENYSCNRNRLQCKKTTCNIIKSIANERSIANYKSLMNPHFCGVSLIPRL